MDKIYKKESIVIFCSIIILLLGYFLYLLVNKINKKYNKKTTENFNNSKRSKMMRIYKNDTILDPDENPYEESDDPDSSRGRDPDS